MKRSLALRREAVAELTSADRRAVVAGAAPSGLTCPVYDCLSDLCELTRQPRCA